MLRLISQITEQEENSIKNILDNFVDAYGDFYVTKNNYRLYIKENLDVFFKDLRQGDKVVFSEEGIAAIVGYADKFDRKYLKILANNIDAVESLLKAVEFGINIDLYAKLKKNNPLVQMLLQFGFEFKGGRGKEVLLYKAKSVSGE
jgi:predicted MPP superfamily phosphohydrolase